MIYINPNRPFQASWNALNARLNPNNDGIFWSLVRKTKNFIFYIPNSIIATCINPRAEAQLRQSSEHGRVIREIITPNWTPLNESNTQLNQNNVWNFWSLARRGKNFVFPSPTAAGSINSRDEMESGQRSELFTVTKEIITPDQVHLTAHIHFKDNPSDKTPTVILFNPLGANDSVHSALKTALLARNCNIVTFNYRGLGSTWRAEDLIVDGDSVYQYVIRELGTQQNKVHFYGFSLGGVIAAQVKALQLASDGKYVGDRPFRSVFSLIIENCCIERCGWLIKKITSFVSSIFLAYPIYLLGWEWDGDEALAQLKGEKRIIYHPNDWLIPRQATLASICPDQEVIKLDLDPTKTGLSTHFDSIESHFTNKIPAIAIVADFLADVKEI